jgi:putative addiction module CopG family antidote
MSNALSPEVERLILEKVQTGRYRTADEVVLLALTLLQQQEEAVAPERSQTEDLATLFASISVEVPVADWDVVPPDLSVNLDSYLYHAHKS